MTAQALTDQTSPDLSQQDEGTYEDLSWVRKKHDGKNETGGSTILFYPLGEAPTAKEIAAQDWQKEHYKYASHIQFLPFPASVAAEDLGAGNIRYYKYYFEDEDKFDAASWIDKRIKRPQNADVKLNIQKYRGATVSVKAVRGDRVETIKWNMPEDKPIIPFLEEKYAYIERNVKRPTEEQIARITISSIGQAIVDKLQPRGVDLFHKWLERIESDRTNGDLSLAGPMIGNGVDVSKVHFTFDEAFRYIAVTIEKESEWTFVEDAKGSTMTLTKILPETVISGLKGQDFSKVLGMEGAKGLKIKNSRIADLDKKAKWKEAKKVTAIRAESKYLILKRPELSDNPMDQATLKDQIDIYLGPNGKFKTMTADLVVLFKQLTPEQLLTLLEVVWEQERMNCEPFGLISWTVEKRGNHLMAPYTPNIDAMTYDSLYGEADRKAA